MGCGAGTRYCMGSYPRRSDFQAAARPGRRVSPATRPAYERFRRRGRRDGARPPDRMNSPPRPFRRRSGAYKG